MLLYFQKLWNDERFRAPVQVLLVYLLWKAFYHFIDIPGTALHSYWDNAMFHIGTWYARTSSFLLTPFVQHTYAGGISIFMYDEHNNKVIWVEEHCLAIPAMAIFAGIVIIGKGAVSDKAWFIPLGFVAIIIINLVRLFFVSLAWLYLTPLYYQIHHAIIYVVITYSCIFLMLAWWMKRNAKKAF